MHANNESPTGSFVIFDGGVATNDKRYASFFWGSWFEIEEDAKWLLEVARAMREPEDAVSEAE
jgi:hypothetical protein